MDKRRIGFRGSGIAVIAGLIVGVGLSSVSILKHKDAGSRSVSPLILSQGLMDPFDPNAPLLTGGVPVTIAQAPARVDFPLHLPNHELASNTTVTKGSAVDDEVAFMYESGVRAYFRKWPKGGDPLAFYSEQVAEPDGVGKLMDIGGNPAWVVEQNEQAEEFPPYAFVDISIGSLQVVLKWEGPAEDLVEIAKTLT